MDNHSWLRIKSFHKFAFVVQVLYIHLPVSPSFLFLVSMRKSPFDAVPFLFKSCVWKRPRPLLEKNIPRTES